MLIAGAFIVSRLIATWMRISGHACCWAYSEFDESLFARTAGWPLLGSNSGWGGDRWSAIPLGHDSCHRWESGLFVILALFFVDRA